MTCTLPYCVFEAQLFKITTVEFASIASHNIQSLSFLTQSKCVKNLFLDEKLSIEFDDEEAL